MSIRLVFDIQRIIFTVIIILSGIYLVLYLLKEILFLFKKEPKKEKVEKDVIIVTKDKIKYRVKENAEPSSIIDDYLDIIDENDNYQSKIQEYKPLTDNIVKDGDNYRHTTVKTRKTPIRKKKRKSLKLQ